MGINLKTKSGKDFSKYFFEVGKEYLGNVHLH